MAWFNSVPLFSVPAVIPGFHNNQFVGTAMKGDTVHLPCQLTNMHEGLNQDLYEVRWRQGDDNIVYGERYSKMTDNSLVIEDFQEEDTNHRYYCYITKIGSDNFGGNYPVSGPRQLFLLGELWRAREGGVSGWEGWSEKGCGSERWVKVFSEWQHGGNKEWGRGWEEVKGKHEGRREREGEWTAREQRTLSILMKLFYLISVCTSQ